MIIILVGIVLFNVSIGLYTLINMYIVGEITNKVVAGFNRKKLVIIISPFSEIIGLDYYSTYWTWRYNF